MEPTGSCDRIDRLLDGLWISSDFSNDSIRSAFSYKPVPGDVFIVSYPKCGTTWMQYLLYNIVSGGTAPKNAAEFETKSPFLDLCGAEGVEKMQRPGAIKTHLPFGKHPYSKDAKYFYVSRNPYDCCVSYYYHTKRFPAYGFEDGTFDQFLNKFAEGKWDYGDYFDHLLSWYEHRDDPNVFFLTYEDLKKDTEAWVLRMADFLGGEYGEKLRGDPALVRRIVEASSVSNMKSVFNEARRTLLVHASPACEGSSGSPRLVSGSVEAEVRKPWSGYFVRKGIVGDWKNHFSPEQIERLKRRIAMKTAGSDVMQLWKDCGLP